MKRYCGRYFSDEEIGQLCALIAEHPSGTRAQLSRWASSTAAVAQSRRRSQGDELPGGHAAHAS